MLKIAIYGKGGIGKSTVTSNLAAAFAAMGKRVIQIGCDPKADSTINLLGGEPLRPVMNYMREEDEEPERLEDISKEGFGGVLCIETGGPTPGLGCAGRGIIATFQLLEDLKLFETWKPDVVLYDVLGDVVCGGFAAPIREGYAEKVLIVTSGEKMALYAANNISSAVRNFEDRSYARIFGIVLNHRNVENETEKVQAFAEKSNIPIVGERFDGHEFIIPALENGCAISICENSKISFSDGANKPIILVDSIEEGLKKILNFSIGYIKKPVVGITGSTGKSTTRRMTAHILERHMNILTSNRYNTVWGNAKLLGEYTNEDAILLECGMDRVGEISWHVNSVDPDIGVLLNICDVHAEKVGGIDKIFNEKKDLADYMEKTGKPLVLNIDDERLRYVAENYNKNSPLITFGKNPEATFVLSNISY